MTSELKGKGRSLKSAHQGGENNDLIITFKVLKQFDDEDSIHFFGRCWDKTTR